jgi:nitrate/TMAO reductase-like tetraheme cytochrome c subunit
MERFSPHQKKLIFLISSGALSIIFLMIGGYKLIEFSDSTQFCGTLCHNVMNPEYTAYQASPHSRVLCSDCHVGPGASYLVKSKINGVPMIWATLTGNFDRPIPVPVKNLRPARETCEQCHRPEKFTGDVVQVHTTYLTDELNTPQVDSRVIRIGAGSSGAASGIHWHVAAKVWYLPVDEKRQEVGWVGIEGPDGQYVTEYVEPLKASTITPAQIAKDKRLMDCIDCHNRATHIFQTPEQLIDSAILEKRIDNSLPFIKREGARALYPVNSSLESAYSKIDSISDFYQKSYPKVYSEKKPLIDRAIVELKNVAQLTTFPEMKTNWNSYDDNIGHQNFAGCFRCHGKLVDSKGGQVGKTIDVSCELCHYLTTPNN